MLKRIFNKANGLWAILLIGLACLYGYLMKPDVTGFLYDDGMYLMAAKALASGEGYRLSGIVGQPWLYKYPPLYPLSLAGIWLSHPQFPQNIVWLKGFNILLVLFALGLWGYYFQTIRRFPRCLALGLVALIGTNWRLIEVTIELMSEPLFMAISTLTLILCHRFSEGQRTLTPRQILVLVLLSVAAFYTRTMALPLIGALGIWLWTIGQRKQAAGYWLGCLTLMLPWFLWSATKKDTTYALGDFLVRSFQETYFQSFRMDLRYEYTLPELVGKGISELLGNLSVAFFPLLERFFLDKPTILSESLILGLSFGFAIGLGRYAYQQVKARQFSPEGIYVALYLAILPFWSFHKVYPRFLMPLLPVLWAILLIQLTRLNLGQKWKFLPHTLIAVGICLNGLHLMPYLQKENPNSLLAGTPQNVWVDYAETLDYLKHSTPQNSRLYIENIEEAYLFPLYTGRKTLDFFTYLPESAITRQCPNEHKTCLLNLYTKSAHTTAQVLKKKRVDYIIVSPYRITNIARNSWYPLKKSMLLFPQLQALNPQAYQPVFQTRDGWLTVYRVNSQAL